MRVNPPCFRSLSTRGSPSRQYSATSRNDPISGPWSPPLAESPLLKFFTSQVPRPIPPAAPLEVLRRMAFVLFLPSLFSLQDRLWQVVLAYHWLCLGVAPSGDSSAYVEPRFLGDPSPPPGLCYPRSRLPPFRTLDFLSPRFSPRSREPEWDRVHSPRHYLRSNVPPKLVCPQRPTPIRSPLPPSL